MTILKITILKVTSFKLWIFFVIYLIRFLWYTKYQVHSILTIGEVAMCVMCCSITFNNSTNSPKNSKVEGIIPILLQCTYLYVLWLPDFALKSPIQPWLPDNWKWKRQFSLLGWPWLYAFSVVDVMTWEHVHHQTSIITDTCRARLIPIIKIEQFWFYIIGKQCLLNIKVFIHKRMW